MVSTKGIQATTENWKKSQSRVQSEYMNGINRTTDWQASAIAGEDNYGAGVTRAVSEKSRAKGIAKVSDADWKKAALDKGAQRIVAGMQAAEPKFASKMANVLNVIESTQIAPRGPDAASNVTGRVLPLAQALQDAKRSGNL